MREECLTSRHSSPRILCGLCGAQLPRSFYLPKTVEVMRIKMAVPATARSAILVPLGGDEVQTLVKFVNLRSPHPQPLSHRERVAEGRVRGESATETQGSAVRARSLHLNEWFNLLP